ncbi:MAG: rod shape-determining protein [Actinomycetes bacterium]
MALDVAIDVGTTVTRLATADGSVFLREASVVAIDTRTGDIVDIGESAMRNVGRDPRHVVNFRPLANGTTIDFDVAARLIRALFDRAGFSRMSRVHATMSVPAFATSIERRALRQAALQAGAVDATLIEAPIAAAIGAGLQVDEPVAAPIIMLGGGASETALISLGGIVTSKSVRIGGSHLDESIASALRQRYGVVVAPHIAESLKNELGSLMGSRRSDLRVVPARTVDVGLPVSVEVPSEVVDAAIADHVRTIVRSVKECLGEAPPDLSQDVSVRGIFVVGGVAQLHDFPELLTHEVGVSCTTVLQPDLVVIRGLLRCLTELRTLHRSLRLTDV